MLRDKVEDALKQVFDPELPVNIFELGLIYKTEINQGNNVRIYMTLTAPACAASQQIMQDVENGLKAIDEIGEVEVRLTFDPPWDKEMMSEEAKLELGWF